MKELLEIIVRNLVDNPEEVKITEVENGDVTTLELRVAKEDMGKVIGKHGRIAKAIRSIIKSAAIHNNVKINVDIVNVDEE